MSPAVQNAAANSVVDEAGFFLRDGSVGYEQIRWYIGAREGTGSGVHRLSISLGLVVAVTCILAVTIRITSRPRHINTGNQSCRMCSYDLTGNTSGVCPECGTATEQKAGS